MPVKLGSALYTFRKNKGILETPKVTLIKFPQNNGGSRLKAPADWSHEVHGDHYNVTASDLVSMFPQLKLDQANLSRVKSGKQKSHKGWTLKKVLKEEVVKVSFSVPSNVTDIKGYSEDLLERGA